MTRVLGKGHNIIYTPELAKRICDAIAVSTDKIDDIIASVPGAPENQTVRMWVFTRPDFKEMYESAKKMQASLFAEKLLHIANDTTVCCRETIDN